MLLSSTLDRLAVNCPSLYMLPSAALGPLAQLAYAFNARQGDVLFDSGHPCAGLPLLTSGAVRVTRPLPSGQDVPLYRVGPGEVCVLSLRCMVTGGAYSVRGTALDDVEGVLVPPAAFRALFEAHPPFRDMVLAQFAARVEGMVGLLEQVAASRLDERLASLLLQRGPVLATTHRALADELGTAREVVSRILESFETRGAVRLRRGRVEILDGSRFGRVPRQTTPAERARLAG